MVSPPYKKKLECGGTYNPTCNSRNGKPGIKMIRLTEEIHLIMDDI
jgi:hypothetical protein